MLFLMNRQNISIDLCRNISQNFGNLYLQVKGQLNFNVYGLMCRWPDTCNVWKTCWWYPKEIFYFIHLLQFLFLCFWFACSLMRFSSFLRWLMRTFSDNLKCTTFTSHLPAFAFSLLLKENIFHCHGMIHATVILVLDDTLRETRAF